MVGSGALTGRVEAELGFALTGAQRLAIAEIAAEMAQPRRMMRLLQGDVGSGKTVVALMAMLTAVESGGQAALARRLTRNPCSTGKTGKNPISGRLGTESAPLSRCVSSKPEGKFPKRAEQGIKSAEQGAKNMTYALCVTLGLGIAAERSRGGRKVKAIATAPRPIPNEPI